MVQKGSWRCSGVGGVCCPGLVVGWTSGRGLACSVLCGHPSVSLGILPVSPGSKNIEKTVVFGQKTQKTMKTKAFSTLLLKNNENQWKPMLFQHFGYKINENQCVFYIFAKKSMKTNENQSSFRLKVTFPISFSPESDFPNNFSPESYFSNHIFAWKLLPQLFFRLKVTFPIICFAWKLLFQLFFCLEVTFRIIFPPESDFSKHFSAWK